MAQNPVLLETTAKMAETALFTEKPTQTINNSEGAILFQVLFQAFKGTQTLDGVISQILDRIRQRMGASFQPVHVMKHLIGIFMSAMYYNSQLTVSYLESQGLTTQIVQEMINLRKAFKHEYERKFFIVGLSEMLRCPSLPQSLQPVLI